MVYDEWVRVDESVTRVQLAMRVAKVFNDFVEVRVTSSFCIASTVSVLTSCPSLATENRRLVLVARAA